MRLWKSHTEIECRASDIGLLPRIVYQLDEPIGDAIVVPMYRLAQEAKKQVTVILAGEGADETLGGYLFHRALLWGYRFGRAIPPGLRRTLLIPALRVTPAGLINLAFSYPAALGKRGKLKLLDFMTLLGPEQLPAAYRHLISLFDERDVGGLFTPEFETQLAQTHTDTTNDVQHGVSHDADAPYLNRILHLQFQHWLQDDILMKQDKMSMAHGIEARVPFLDHEFVEYALRLPPSAKLRGFTSKSILRRYTAKVLPRRVSARRKMPFYVPIEGYLADPVFREIVDDTLSSSSVRARGIFRPEAIAALRDTLRAGEFVHARQVLSLVILELWFRMAVDRRGAL